MKIFFLLITFFIFQGSCSDVELFQNAFDKTPDITYEKFDDIQNKSNNHSEVSFTKEVLANEIKALIFTDEMTLMDDECLKDYEGIELKGICVKNIMKFKKEFSCFLHRPLTFEILKRIEYIALCYFKKNTPYLVDVKILENQDITSGKVQILVIFARLGEVTLHKGKYFSDAHLKQKLDLKSDEYIDIHKIQKSLASINQNPFRNTSFILEPGEKLGYTNIHFQTQDMLPLRVFSGYENTGNEIASQHRFLVGINFGNFLYLDHQMNIEFKFAKNISKWWGISGNYIMPSFYDTYLKVIGSYVKTKPDTEPNYDIRGKAWVVLARYHIPIYFFENTVSELIFGYDFKQTNNFLDFLKVSIFQSFIDISQFVFQFNSTVNDRYGLTSYLFSFYYSPGDMTKHNEDQDFQKEGYAKKSRYFYATLYFDRTFLIPKDFLYVMEFFSQVSSTKILPTEQISIGGFYTVRGYQENALFGDNGFYLRNELRLPKMKYFKCKNKNHAWQFLAFVDLGYVSQIDDNISQKKAAFLASVGPGLRFGGGTNFILKLDYGIQLKKANRDFFAKSWHSKLHAFVSLQY